MPPSPCGRNKVERDGEGGRGAHMEAVAVADIGPDAGRGQRVVVAAALRKKARSGAVGRADAGQTRRVLP